jgi:hypothetical protein
MYAVMVGHVASVFSTEMRVEDCMGYTKLRKLTNHRYVIGTELEPSLIHFLAPVD